MCDDDFLRWPWWPCGLVVAEVTLATDDLKASAKAEFGAGLVELDGVLTPV